MTESLGAPLRLAAITENTELVRLLLDNGADANTQTNGETALHVANSPPYRPAAFGGYKNIIRLLLSKGADINAHEGSYGRTPLHLAVEADFTSAIAELLKQGARTGRQDFNDATPLELALQKRNHEAVMLLFPRSTGSLCLLEADFGFGKNVSSGNHVDGTVATRWT
ncbi:ankyrin-2 [Penicillium sp. IBT 16267x]|nr:ankyrin-2 [Penicillium sp. IBT 16267x]